MNEHFLKLAIDEGFQGMRSDAGGPFGAVIVLDGEIIARAHNTVTSTNDPSAHAEVNALRIACAAQQTFHLPDAILYASCEPCPMCLTTTYWAGIRTVYYAATRDDAADAGFDDKVIYDEMTNGNLVKVFSLTQMDLPEAKALFEEWRSKVDRIDY